MTVAGTMQSGAMKGQRYTRPVNSTLEFIDGRPLGLIGGYPHKIDTMGQIAMDCGIDAVVRHNETLAQLEAEGWKRQEGAYFRTGVTK